MIYTFLSILIFVYTLFAGNGVGERATDFTLRTTDGQEITLSELRGRIVVLVFLEPSSGASMSVARQMETELWQDDFQNRVIYMFGILVGASIEAGKEFKNGLNLTFPILVDPSRAVWNTYRNGANPPLSIIIGKDGVVQYCEQGFSAPEISNKVRQLQSSGINFTTWWKIKELFRKGN